MGFTALIEVAGLGVQGLRAVRLRDVRFPGSGSQGLRAWGARSLGFRA